MKRKRTTKLLLLAILVFLGLCAAIIPSLLNDKKPPFDDVTPPFVTETAVQTATQTATSTSTVTPTLPPTQTATSTVSPTLASTLQNLVERAKAREMFVVILFTPNVQVDRYFNEVEEVTGYSAEDLLGKEYPELLAKVNSENYYKEYGYFKVMLVGGYKCETAEYCSDPPVYFYNDIYLGKGLGHFRDATDGIENGFTAVHWQPNEYTFCVEGQMDDWCSRRIK